MLDYAQESENDLKLYARWVVGYQHASTFIEFKNKLMQGTKRDDRSAEDILQSVEELLTRF